MRARSLWKNDSGASAAEYTLVLAIIGGAIALGALVLGGSISGSMNRATDDIENCRNGC